MAYEVKRPATVDGSALILTHSSFGLIRIACTLGTISIGASFLNLGQLYTWRQRSVNAAFGAEGEKEWRRGSDSNRRIKVLQTSPLAAWVPRQVRHED